MAEIDGVKKNKYYIYAEKNIGDAKTYLNGKVINYYRIKKNIGLITETPDNLNVIERAVKNIPYKNQEQIDDIKKNLLDPMEQSLC